MITRKGQTEDFFTDLIPAIVIMAIAMGVSLAVVGDRAKNVAHIDLVKDRNAMAKIELLTILKEDVGGVPLNRMLAEIDDPKNVKYLQLVEEKSIISRSPIAAITSSSRSDEETGAIVYPVPIAAGPHSGPGTVSSTVKIFTCTEEFRKELNAFLKGSYGRWELVLEQGGLPIFTCSKKGEGSLRGSFSAAVYLPTLKGAMQVSFGGERA